MLNYVMSDLERSNFKNKFNRKSTCDHSTREMLIFSALLFAINAVVVLGALSPVIERLYFKDKLSSETSPKENKSRRVCFLTGPDSDGKMGLECTQENVKSKGQGLSHSHKIRVPTSP